MTSAASPVSPAVAPVHTDPAVLTTIGSGSVTATLADGTGLVSTPVPSSAALPSVDLGAIPGGNVRPVYHRSVAAIADAVMTMAQSESGSSDDEGEHEPGAPTAAASGVAIADGAPASAEAPPPPCDEADPDPDDAEEEAAADGGDRRRGPRQLMINYLPDEASTAELRAVFEQFGTVDYLRIVNDRDTGRRKGYGFVYYNDPEHAAVAAEKLTGMTLYGKRLRVGLAAVPRRGNRGRGNVHRAEKDGATGGFPSDAATLLRNTPGALTGVPPAAPPPLPGIPVAPGSLVGSLPSHVASPAMAHMVSASSSHQNMSFTHPAPPYPGAPPMPPAYPMFAPSVMTMASSGVNTVPAALSATTMPVVGPPQALSAASLGAPLPPPLPPPLPVGGFVHSQMMAGQPPMSTMAAPAAFVQSPHGGASNSFATAGAPVSLGTSSVSFSGFQAPVVLSPSLASRHVGTAHAAHAAQHQQALAAAQAAHAAVAAASQSPGRSTRGPPARMSPASATAQSQLDVSSLALAAPTHMSPGAPPVRTVAAVEPAASGPAGRVGLGSQPHLGSPLGSLPVSAAGSMHAVTSFAFQQPPADVSPTTAGLAQSPQVLSLSLGRPSVAGGSVGQAAGGGPAAMALHAKAPSLRLGSAESQCASFESGGALASAVPGAGFAEVVSPILPPIVPYQ